MEGHELDQSLLKPNIICIENIEGPCWGFLDEWAMVNKKADGYWLLAISHQLSAISFLLPHIHNPSGYSPLFTCSERLFCTMGASSL
jgi:hypothetical protein